ncbi:MAG TPA: hypothetical protein PKY13_09125 [Microthrixaceae bacterium]|jgi:hypothetical protein|nr:hypothetical protein [Microthrixaceae bacterium]HQF93262.1 hypothetical protein [Microthrixaceae bacterium]
MTDTAPHQTELPHVSRSGEFPAHMPDTGERVPADPSNFIRDLFLANGGRINARLVDNAIARHTFTYGAAITEAWESLRTDSYVETDGEEWIWPEQLAYLDWASHQ